MTNSEMKAGRYLRWHKARKTVAAIQGHLRQGRTVVLATYTKAAKYNARHVDMFKATKTGAYVQRGKSWDCFDGCAIRVYR